MTLAEKPPSPERLGGVDLGNGDEGVASQTATGRVTYERLDGSAPCCGRATDFRVIRSRTGSPAS